MDKTKPPVAASLQYLADDQPWCFIMTAEIPPVLSLVFQPAADTDRTINCPLVFQPAADTDRTPNPLMLQPLCWH